MCVNWKRCVYTDLGAQGTINARASPDKDPSSKAFQELTKLGELVWWEMNLQRPLTSDQAGSPSVTGNKDNQSTQKTLWPWE